MNRTAARHAFWMAVAYLIVLAGSFTLMAGVVSLGVSMTGGR